jgi:dTDP-4-dehydrorhamnose reductase
MPSVDACEINPEKCWAINVEGVSNVIHVAKEIGAKVVFFSTDYVFDGQCGPYSEADEPHPINVYGKAKLFAERVVEETLEDYLIVRVNALYGWELERKNFVMGLIERLSGGQEMRVPVDQVGCPTYAENLVDAILELVDLKQRGILHVAGNCPMNRYEFACTAAEIFGLNKSLLVPIKTPELEQKAPRPLKAGLRIEKAQQILSTRLLGPREGLGLMKREGDPFRRNLGESVTSAD